MKLSRQKAASLLTILFLINLALVNRDLFRFEYHDPYDRSFSPKENDKGYYYLGETIFLKPGVYRLELSGELPQSSSEISLVSSDGAVLYTEEFERSDGIAVFNFQISGQPQNVRLRLNYDPQSGPIQINHIQISSEHVLYKGTILRHVIVSLICSLVYLILLLRILKPYLIFRWWPFLADKKNEWSLFILILLTLLVCLPLFHPGKYIEGADTYFHLCRLSAVAANLNAGLFPPRVELFWLDNIGYGVGFFYSEFFMIFFSVFLLPGFPILSIYKTMWVTIVFFTLVSHFWAAKTISGGSRKAGIAAAIFIALTNYRLLNQYTRDGVGEAFAIIFMPLIAAGLFLIFKRKPGGWKILAFGFSGTLLSHTISFILTVIFTAVFLLTQIRRLLKNSGIIIDILKAAVFSIGLCAFFLFPMLEQKYAVPEIKINQVTSGKLDMSYATSTQSIGNVLLFFQSDGLDKRIYYYPGWPLLSVPLLGIMLLLRKEKNLYAAHLMTAAGFIILLVSTDLFPWQMIQPFLNDIQFTWRLVQTTVIFLSISGGIYVSRFCLTDQITRRVFLVQLLICTIPAVMAVASIRQHRLHDSNEFYLQNHHTYGSEYMFPELSRKYIKENISTLTDNAGNASFSDFRRNDLKIEFAYNENRENEIDFTVPFLYYKGYAAAVRDADDKTMKLSAEAAENGFVRIRGNAPPHGHISVWYDGTIIQKISDIISLLTLTGCILFALRRKRIHL